MTFSTSPGTRPNVYFDVFLLLRQGDELGAKKRIDSHRNKITDWAAASDEARASHKPSVDVIPLEILDPETLGHFLRTAEFQQWMLYMHPAQQDIVDQDFSGPAKLSGVSGSGKTSVLIKRAIRLALKYPRDKILILTLNQSLARLIKTLVEYACPDSGQLRQNIEVLSFWELARHLLFRFEPTRHRLYDDETWKIKERVEDIWREYYECRHNNSDAEVLLPVHKSLLASSISPLEYLYQEITWIRSAFAEKQRHMYLSAKREGRAIPFQSDFRQALIKGLKGWEDMMEFVGVIDYLGLATALYRQLDSLHPLYRCVLVDEVQDFGTMELGLMRRLVAPGENDLFLAGDIAQRVTVKHHSLADIGISVTGRSRTILRNYRNSRQILEAAYAVLRNNLPAHELQHEEFEILAPEYSTFTTPKPLLLEAESLASELSHCLAYLDGWLTAGRKACIALAGYGPREVRDIGEQLSITPLTGETDIAKHSVFISDLEQTKGFEFDIVCVLGCSGDIIPDTRLPKGESFREMARLYVAMTRAKLELIVSYSKEMSPLFRSSVEFFTLDVWSAHASPAAFDRPVLPETHRDLPKLRAEELLEMSGRRFLYHPQAVGAPKAVLEKLDSVITGRSVSGRNRQTQWRSIGEFLAWKDNPARAQAFGPETLQQTLDFFGALGIGESFQYAPSGEQQSVQGSDAIHISMHHNLAEFVELVRAHKDDLIAASDLAGHLNHLAMLRVFTLSEQALANSFTYVIGSMQGSRDEQYDALLKKLVDQREARVVKALRERHRLPCIDVQECLFVLNRDSRRNRDSNYGYQDYHRFRDLQVISGRAISFTVDWDMLK